MSNKYAHFIITRFNLKLGFNVDKNNVSTQTDEWLEKRFDMFEKYCLPSVAAQTNRNFVWLCMFDDQTPACFLERIEQYRKISPELHPVFLSSEQAQNIARSVYGAIKAVLGDNAAEISHVVTTNLDNDDSLSVYAVEQIQNNIKPDGYARIYSLLYGYQYFVDTGFAIKMRYYNNHFLTLCEPFGESMMGINSYRHGNVIRTLPTTYIKTGKGMWIEFVHDNNVRNGYRVNSRAQYIPVFRGRDFRKDFGVEINVKGFPQIVNNFTSLPYGYLTTGIRSLVTKSKRK